MNEHEPAKTHDANSTTPSQAELYEDLRRIGELEDQKQHLQKEIDQLTDKLRDAVQYLDKESLLHQMLVSTLKPKSPVATRRTPKKAPPKRGKRGERGERA